MSTLSAEELELLGEMPPEDLPSPASQGAAASAAASRSGYDAIVFDIETGPLSEEEIWKVIPKFDPSTLKPFGEFDAAAVKLGNIKDPIKQAEKIEACRTQHAADKAAHDAKNASAEEEYRAKVIGSAALSALTGRVLAIGYYFTEDESTDVEFIGQPVGDHAHRTEISVITSFWNYIEAASENCRVVGHNIRGFDVSFLVQRSWILNIEVPRSLFEKVGFFASRFVDTMGMWACGRRGGNEFVGLDPIAKAFNVGSKTGSGAMFAELFEKDQAAAIEYLKNDVAITYAVAKRMGVCK